MTLRIDVTDEAGESAVWTPTADTVVQVTTVRDSKALVEIQGRLDASAPWVTVVSGCPADTPMMTCIKLAQLKLVYRNNKAGDPLKAWSVE